MPETRPSSSRPPTPHPFSLAATAASRLIPLGASYKIAIAIADLFYFAWGSKRETAKRNYARILNAPVDSPEVEKAVRDSFRHFGRYIAELLHVQGWGLGRIKGAVTLYGEEHIEEALAHGRGVIFVSGHMGSMEVASTIVLLRNFKVTSVTEQLRPKFLMDWLLSSRARMGVTLLPVANSGYRLLRTLRNKEMIALVVDVGVRGYGEVPVQFFGRQTYFPGGPARLARLSGAPVLFGVGLRDSDTKFVAYVSPPVFADREADAEQDVMNTTQKLVDIFEAYVRRYPGQWYAFRDMWPQDEAPSA